MLLCNRDERHTRKPAIGPRLGKVREVSFVAPVDGDHRGSWIGTNQFGLTLCLLNRYGEWIPIPDRDYTSRGLLLTDLLDSSDSQHFRERLSDIELNRFQPFTMLALSVGEPALLINWTGTECTLQPDAEALMPLTSSSLKNSNLGIRRRELFAEMASQRTNLDLELLDEFHRSHLPERGPASVCMHRDDAATVSLSTVVVNPASVEFLYHPNSPCLRAPSENVLLERVVVQSQVVTS